MKQTKKKETRFLIGKQMDYDSMPRRKMVYKMDMKL